MKDFFARAWANPVTTFSGLVAVLGVLGPDLADCGVIVAKSLHIAAGVAGVLLAMAAKDAAVNQKGSAP